MKFSLKFLKKEKHKESANKEANNEYQRDEQIETFEQETKDLTAFMSISLCSPDESIAPSTSKKTESKSFSKHSIQKKKEIKKKRCFSRTKFPEAFLFYKNIEDEDYCYESYSSNCMHSNIVDYIPSDRCARHANYKMVSDYSHSFHCPSHKLNCCFD